MKISRTRIAIIISACILLVIIILSLGRPQSKPAATIPQTGTEEQPVPQVGKYELPPAQKNAEPSLAQKEIPAAGTETTSQETQKNADILSAGKESAEKGGDEGYDSADPSLPQPPPKLPPPEKMQEMRQRGIVAF